MGVAFIINGLLSMFFYLKQSPLPPDTEETKIGCSLKVLGFSLISLFMFQGCATTGEGFQVSAQETYDRVLPFVRPAVSLTCSAVLNVALSAEDAKDKANYIYSVATAVRSLSTGVVPSVEQVENVINLWSPDKAHWAKLSKSISSVYGGVFAKIKDEPKLAIQVLEQIALGCEDSAGAIK